MMTRQRRILVGSVMVSAVSVVLLASASDARQSPARESRATNSSGKSSAKPDAAAKEVETIASLRERWAQDPKALARLRDLESRLELVRRGLLPVHRIDGNHPRAIPAPNPAQFTEDRGTKIVTHPDARGEMLELQREIAQALSNRNLRPPARDAHFAWLQDQPLLRDGTVRFIGWHGGIVDVAPAGPETWVVKVHIYPWLAAVSMKTAQPDHVVETYRYSKGRVELIASDAETPKPQLRIFPWSF
ncbi:MAG: hypothetical protein SFX72_10660 [Isosphaeraceae bacterium]|nr:hypothetical protein [Isosphaeraceae bacterium]